jgi:DNA-binding response OmpR family regulator
MARLLVVEDDPLTRMTLADVLAAAGFEVSLAEDGLAGLAAARRLRPDLILLDLMIPRLDGLRVAHLLHFDRALGHIPIVILTARAGEDDRAQAEAHGAAAYLVKPVDLDRLVATIRSLLAPAAAGPERPHAPRPA